MSQSPNSLTSEDGPPVVPPEGSEGTVLLVDDDAAVRRVTARYLVLLGYAVIEAANPADALALAAVDVRIDVVVSDIALPGMRGPALLQELRVGRPTVGAVLMTGFALEALHPGDWPPGTGLLEKPFDIDELRLSLNRCRTGSASERRR
jgi:DNA-binding NtrC family response regulator